MRDTTGETNGETLSRANSAGMGYLMEWMDRTPPSYLEGLTDKGLIEALKLNLQEAGMKVQELARARGETPSHPIPELEFLGDALKRLSAGETVEANPFMKTP